VGKHEDLKEVLAGAAEADLGTNKSLSEIERLCWGVFERALEEWEPTKLALARAELALKGAELSAKMRSTSSLEKDHGIDPLSGSSKISDFFDRFAKEG